MFRELKLPMHVSRRSEKKGFELRQYVLAERALHRNSIFHYCTASCGWEAHNKMQIEDCPSLEDQSRLFGIGYSRSILLYIFHR